MVADKHILLELTYCFLPLCRFAFVFVIMAATDSVQTTKTISLQVLSPTCAFVTEAPATGQPLHRIECTLLSVCVFWQNS